MSHKFLETLQVHKENIAISTGRRWSAGSSSQKISSSSPVNGQELASIQMASEQDYNDVVSKAQQAFPLWRKTPAPARGLVIADIGQKLRKHKNELGELVSYEMGKSLQEGKGEVQEMIDICDYALGLSRSMAGRTMFSERPDHRMYEQWHPLGVVGIISAFNFPVAVWSWNAMIAAVCGNVSIWKPSEKTPLCGIACQKIAADVLANILRVSIFFPFFEHNNTFLILF